MWKHSGQKPFITISSRCKIEQSNHTEDTSIWNPGRWFSRTEKFRNGWSFRDNDIGEGFGRSYLIRRLLGGKGTSFGASAKILSILVFSEVTFMETSSDFNWSRRSLIIGWEKKSSVQTACEPILQLFWGKCLRFRYPTEIQKPSNDYANCRSQEICIFWMFAS